MHGEARRVTVAKSAWPRHLEGYDEDAWLTTESDYCGRPTSSFLDDTKRLLGREASAEVSSRV